MTASPGAACPKGLCAGGEGRAWLPSPRASRPWSGAAMACCAEGGFRRQRGFPCPMRSAAMPPPRAGSSLRKGSCWTRRWPTCLGWGCAAPCRSALTRPPTWGWVPGKITGIGASPAPSGATALPSMPSRKPISPRRLLGTAATYTGGRSAAPMGKACYSSRRSGASSACPTLAMRSWKRWIIAMRLSPSPG